MLGSMDMTSFISSITKSGGPYDKEQYLSLLEGEV